MKLSTPTAIMLGTLSVLVACGGEQRDGAGRCPDDTPLGGATAAGKLAFSGGDGIFLINADGCGLTSINDWGWDPIWSPDGEQIAFQSCEGDLGSSTCDIYLINADGSGLTNLSDYSGQEGYGVTWSPDARRLAFRSDRDGDYEIYVVNADGSGLAKLTNNHADDFAPAWSPDGSRIAFQSDRDGNDDIYIMNTDGSDQINLTKDPEDSIFELFTISLGEPWSPDGKQIAFHKCSWGASLIYCDIFVMNPDGSNPVNLTNSPANDSDVSWSPDGSQIAFGSNRDGDLEIYAVNADGSGLVNLTQDPASDEDYPAWSPDGSQIAYESGYMIYVMNANGSEKTLLADSGVATSKAWAPVSGR